MKIYSIITVVCLSIGTALAQENIQTLRGRLQTSTGEAVSTATVVFRSPAGKGAVYTAFTDDQGVYLIDLPRGGYRCSVLYQGESYRPAPERIEVQGDSLLPELRIALPSKVLAEATVVARRPLVSYRGGNISYNLSANPAALGGNLLEGLRLIPGLQMGEKRLSIYGFYNLTVALNQQVLRLSPQELASYVGSLRVEDIEAVEIIRHPGPEYGSNVEAVLNIKTKRGLAESVNAFLSSELSYQALLSESIRMRVNYNRNQWRNYIAYQFADHRDRETLTTSVGRDVTTTDPSRAHSLQIGSEYQLSDRQLLGARALGAFSREELDYNKVSRVGLDSKSASLSLYYLSSGNGWRWNTTVDYHWGNYQRHFPQATASMDGLHDSYHNLRIASDYLLRIFPQTSLLLGAIQTNNWFEGRPVGVTSPGDNGYRERISSAYLRLRYQSERLDSYAGVQLNYDHRLGHWAGATSQMTDELWSWQPYFGVTYTLSPKHQISSSLQTYYQRPAFRDLAPYTSYSGFLSRKGNPNLRNSMRYNLSLSYTYLKAASIELNLSQEQNPIVEYLQPMGGGYAITKTNLDRSRYLRLVLGLPVPIIYRQGGVQWLATTYIAYHYQQDKGAVNTQTLDRNFRAYYLQHKHTLSLPSQWALDAQATYYSPLMVGVYKTRTQWWLDASVSKRIGDVRLSLTAHDLLNTNIARGEILGANTPIQFEKNWHSPKVSLGLSWTIGSRRLKTIERKTAEADSRFNQSASEGIKVGSH